MQKNKALRRGTGQRVEAAGEGLPIYILVGDAAEVEKYVLGYGTRHGRFRGREADSDLVKLLLAWSAMVVLCCVT